MLLLFRTKLLTYILADAILSFVILVVLINAFLYECEIFSSGYLFECLKMNLLRKVHF